MIKIERYDLEKIETEYLEKISQKKRQERNNHIQSCFINNIEKIVLAKPNEFNDWISLFDEYNKPNDESFKKFKGYMNRQYEAMTKECGYWLAEKLNVNTCPYCNRQYTFTIDKKKKTRPQFDHFYPISIYPYFALSFYNLIPCCSICNQIKTDSTKTLLHPYCEGFGDSFYFNINHKDYILNKKKIEVKFNSVNGYNNEFVKKCENNVSEFALKDLYSKHSDYMEEIIEKAYSYNDSFYDSLIHDFSKMGKTHSEIDRLIFGNYIDLADNEKRPLSKLTRDLLRSIGLKG